MTAPLLAACMGLLGVQAALIVVLIVDVNRPRKASVPVAGNAGKC